MITARILLLALPIGLTSVASAQWVEPDDVREYARVALLDTETPVQIHSDDDVDWYRIAVSRDAVLHLDTSDDSLKLVLVTEDGVPVEASLNEADFAVSGGVYFIAASGPVRAAPYHFRYTVRELRGLERLGVDISEPLPAVGQWSISGGTQAVPLRFKLQLDEPAEFTVDLIYDTTKVVPYHMVITDADGSSWPRAKFWAVPQPLRRINHQQTARHLPSGDYAISLYRTRPAEDEVTVVFATSFPNDGFEPNDTRELARRLELPVQAAALSMFPEDNDWFYFEVTEPGIFEITGAPAPDTEWRNVGWPTVSSASEDGPTVAYYFAETGFARYWLAEAGRYFIEMQPKSGRRVSWFMDLEFMPAPSAVDDSNTDFYVLGLEPGEELSGTLSNVASIGGGESIAVSSDDMDMGLSLARIVIRSGGQNFDLARFTKAACQVMMQRLFEQKRDSFEPRSRIGTEFLIETGVFEPARLNESMAHQMKEALTRRLLSPFQNSREDGS